MYLIVRKERKQSANKKCVCVGGGWGEGGGKKKRCEVRWLSRPHTHTHTHTQHKREEDLGENKNEHVIRFLARCLFHTHPLPLPQAHCKTGERERGMVGVMHKS